MKTHQKLSIEEHRKLCPTWNIAKFGTIIEDRSVCKNCLIFKYELSGSENNRIRICDFFKLD